MSITSQENWFKSISEQKIKVPLIPAPWSRDADKPKKYWGLQHACMRIRKKSVALAPPVDSYGPLLGAQRCRRRGASSHFQLSPSRVGRAASTLRTTASRDPFLFTLRNPAPLSFQPARERPKSAKTRWVRRHKNKCAGAAFRLCLVPRSPAARSPRPGSCSLSGSREAEANAWLPSTEDKTKSPRGSVQI